MKYAREIKSLTKFEHLLMLLGKDLIYHYEGERFNS
jgi:hypothetical protein